MSDPRTNVPHGQPPSGGTTSSPDKGDVRPAEGGVGTGKGTPPSPVPPTTAKP